MTLTPARVASLLAALSTLGASLAPAVANLDTTSTAGLLGGAVVILGILDRFLVGQRAHEARVGAPTSTPAVFSATTGVASSGYVTLPSFSNAPKVTVPIADAEPGDPDALAHLPATNTADVPADQGDAGA